MVRPVPFSLLLAQPQAEVVVEAEGVFHHFQPPSPVFRLIEETGHFPLPRIGVGASHIEEPDVLVFELRLLPGHTGPQASLPGEREGELPERSLHLGQKPPPVDHLIEGGRRIAKALCQPGVQPAPRTRPDRIRFFQRQFHAEPPLLRLVPVLYEAPTSTSLGSLGNGPRSSCQRRAIRRSISSDGSFGSFRRLAISSCRV